MENYMKCAKIGGGSPRFKYFFYLFVGANHHKYINTSYAFLLLLTVPM